MNGGRFVPSGGKGLGPGGKCVCPKCEHTTEHIVGKPCMLKKCPKCGTLMRRKIK